MAGNVVGKGYLAGLGMTIGSVFGRIAGREAAPCRNEMLSRRRAPPDHLQFLPLLRRLLRRVPGHGAAPHLPRRRRSLPGEPVPQLRGMLLRLPVRAAARIRRERAARVRAGARRVLPGLRVAHGAVGPVRAQRARGRGHRGGERRGVRDRPRRFTIRRRSSRTAATPDRSTR